MSDDHIQNHVAELSAKVAKLEGQVRILESYVEDLRRSNADTKDALDGVTQQLMLRGR